MKVDANLIKAEREKRAWSQEHLASVSGLGLRTVQRIESSSLASYESVKAIAAALELVAADLVVPKQTVTADPIASLVAAPASAPKTPPGKFKEALAPLVLAAGIILASLVSIPTLDIYWWVGPLVLAIACVAARKIKNVVESRGSTGMLRAFTLAVSTVLAFAIIAMADPKSVSYMVPILGGGLVMAITDPKAKARRCV